MAQYELGIIGAGNMAEAICRSVLTGGLLPAGAILAAEPRDDRRAELADSLGIAVTADNPTAAGCPRVLLAVKPQMMTDVLAEIAPALADDALVISIAAGVTTDTFNQRLGGKGRVVRVMPNTPMLVGVGASAYCAGPRATDADLDWVDRLLATTGLSVRVDTEAELDAVTAVSGSGPAYFFYLVEAMVAAGMAEGLGEMTALALARQTCLGAGRLLCESGEAPRELRRKVTSPGGTTQRAIETMDAADVQARLVDAVRAAAARSRELGA